jgi:hypothetical protein
LICEENVLIGPIDFQQGRQEFASETSEAAEIRPAGRINANAHFY